MIIVISGLIGSGKSVLVNSINTTYETVKIDEHVKTMHQKYQNEIFEIFATNNKKEIFEIITKDKELEKQLQNLFTNDICEVINKYKKARKTIIIEMANVANFKQIMNLVDYVVFINLDPNLHKIYLESKNYTNEMLNNIIKLQKQQNLNLNNYPNVINFKMGLNKEENILNFNKLIRNIIKDEL